jgi:hypothetical protein
MERFEGLVAKEFIIMLDSCTTAKKIRIEAIIANIFLDVILILFFSSIENLKI